MNAFHFSGTGAAVRGNRREPRASIAYALSAAMCVALSLCASAASAQKVVVLPTTAGEGGDAVAALAHTAIRDALGMQGLRVVAWEEAISKLPSGERCDDVAACVPKVMKSAAAEMAAGVVVTRNTQGAAERVRIALLDSDRRRYDGEAEVQDGDVRTATTRALLEARSFQLLGPGPWLRVEGTPEGAEVLVDDRIVGRVPYRATVTPGRHKLRVREAGYTAFEQQLDIPTTDDAHVAQVVVALEPAPIAMGNSGGDLRAVGDSSNERRHNTWLVGPIVLGGAGLVLAGVTTIRLATGLDDCLNPDEYGICTNRRRVNWVPTAIEYSLSAALIGASIAWIIIESKSNEEPALTARFGLRELSLAGSF
jgi:hypothetical protein